MTPHPFFGVGMDPSIAVHQGRWLGVKDGERSSSNRDRLLARFSNYFQIGHNAFEFLLDFGQGYRDSDQAQFHTRIITSPAYARALREILQDAVTKYESALGRIQEEDN